MRSNESLAVPGVGIGHLLPLYLWTGRLKMKAFSLSQRLCNQLSHGILFDTKNLYYKMRLIFVVSSLLYLTVVAGQSVAWAPDSILHGDPAYTVNRYHHTLRYHEPIMYLTVPYINNIKKRNLDLKDGEGKNGAIAEAHFGYRFVIYKGKYYHHRVFQRTRFTFDVSLLLRLANDRSLPLLPTNNKFGLGLDFLLSDPKSLLKETTVPVWLTIQAHHYSNGQAGTFFDNDTVQRNNYIDGDFSTNYVRATLNIARLKDQKNILSTWLGYQCDVDPGGALERSKDLGNYYGNRRLLFGLQWMRRSDLVTAHYRNRATAALDKVAVQRRRQLTIKTELDYITDNDLSRFQGSNKYRLGWHSYFSFMPSVTNEVGFIIHTYVGRDYLNIRFDDVVFIGAAGICVRFDTK
jgi:hypothetical protein